MTRFTVVWLKEVQDDLAEIWMTHHDRESVAEAANVIDDSLASDPWNQGGELKEGIRFFLAPPLRVLYSIKEADRIVEVVLVRSI